MEYSIQLFSVRDLTEKDLHAALRQVAGLGYRYVEFAGFFGHTAEEVRAWLDECGLGVSGTHTRLTELEEDLEGTIAYHKAIGNHNIIIPWHDLDCQSKIDAFVESVNRIQPLLEKEGITLGYHNHSHEFQPNRDGSMIHDQLYCRTALRFEVDTFWFFNAAGFSACGILDRLQDRMDFIHLKDGFRGGKGVPLGTGEAPLREVYDKAIALDLLMVVESETLTPDGITEAKVCMDWLKAQE